MVQSMVCVACGAAVPYGRLSCPSCGELLASVAGARRPSSVEAAPVGEPVSGVDDATAAPAWSDAGLFDLPEAPGPTAAVAPAATVAAAVTAPAAAPMPGAYVPPVLQPAGPPAPARTWGGHAPDGADAGGVAAISAADGDADAAVEASDADRIVEAVGWLAVAGAALIVIGFLLPWSSISVIGAAGVGYFDRWGFAGDGHPLVLIAVLAVLALALLRDRVPLWLGVGLPGLALGGVLFGLVWPYLVGPLGGQIGVFVVALGAVALIVAGAAAIVVDRHARGDRVV